MLNRIDRRILLVAAGALAFAASLHAIANTTVKVQATEGTSADNVLRIQHGCELPFGDTSPVIAQSVMLPTASPQITGSDGSVIGDLSAIITQGTLAGLLATIENRSAFQMQQVKTDALGNVIGFSAYDGQLDAGLEGRIPFQFAGPTFVASSCAKRLLVKVAVADVCARGTSDVASSVKPGQVNLWIPDNGSQFATIGKQQRVVGIGAAPTLIINRNLTTNPLSPACNGGIDVTVTPTAADVDANLPIPDIWASPTAVSSPPGASAVIEYYNGDLDHFFITRLADEIAKLDDGSVIKNWVRTGKTFKTFPTAQGGTSPVCRYYIPPGLGDSHFFGRGTVECDATGQKNPSFVLEDPAFMQMYLPNAGVCPANTKQIYRVFSNRPDANHRYMTDKATRDGMVSLGWLVEGDGPDLVVMCAPQ